MSLYVTALADQVDHLDTLPEHMVVRKNDARPTLASLGISSAFVELG